MVKTAVCSRDAAEPVGPYSQAIVTGSLVFVSGQLGMVLAKKKLSETVEGQTRLALESIGKILAEAGCSMDDVVKTTVLLADMDDFKAVNRVYAEFFNEPFPARAAYQVVKLPLDAMVEIEAVARLKER
ncbi:MAG: Rid family detoxifying hydrolase [Candidatus Sabulitectum sp.]|nr:Rid family detoxifying hydrolase [Candidatus Sabulitectum sp.]